jgi:hypothetical protein
MNWLLQNFRERVVFSLRNPRYALGSLYRELTLSDERCNIWRFERSGQKSS